MSAKVVSYGRDRVPVPEGLVEGIRPPADALLQGRR
jgi:hypothetical protein